MIDSENILNSGRMPNTDFHYEEFEGLLGSYYLSTKPLADGGDQDRADFEKITETLDGFADRHKVQKPQDAIRFPRPTSEDWGQPHEFPSCFSLLDQMGSFRVDFGVGNEFQTIDGQEKLILGRLVLGVLHRHSVIEADFEDLNGNPTPVRILNSERVKFFKPLQEILESE